MGFFSHPRYDGSFSFSSKIQYSGRGFKLLRKLREVRSRGSTFLAQLFSDV